MHSVRRGTVVLGVPWLPALDAAAMTSMGPRRRLLVAVLLVGFAVSVSGVAYAFWSGAGSGVGSGETGAVEAVTLSPANPVAGLYPGGAGAVTLTVSNPNSSPVHIGAFTLDPDRGSGGFAVDTGHAECLLPAPLTFVAQTTGWTVPARGDVAGTLPVALPGALVMADDAPNECQGATITVYLVAGT